MDPQASVESLSFLQWCAAFMNEGGVFMWVIVAVWALGLAVGLERVFQLRRYDVASPLFFADIKNFVLKNEVPQALEFCQRHPSLLARVMKAGLKRVNQHRQQVQDALEATLLECQPLAGKKITWVALFANVCTLLGLLGTIQGLILTFGNVSVQDPTEKAKLLAVGISTAMNTTALGLVCSISLLFIHMHLATKSQKIETDLDEQSMRLIDLLSSRKAIHHQDQDQAA